MPPEFEPLACSGAPRTADAKHLGPNCSIRHQGPAQSRPLGQPAAGNDVIDRREREIVVGEMPVPHARLEPVASPGHQLPVVRRVAAPLGFSTASRASAFAEGNRCGVFSRSLHRAIHTQAIALCQVRAAAGVFGGDLSWIRTFAAVIRPPPTMRFTEADSFAYATWAHPEKMPGRRSANRDPKIGSKQ